MAKRFTDTGKWKRPWFRALGLHAKILWTYLLDECDHSGIFIADFDLISFQVGFKVDAEKMKTWLGDKLVRLDNDKFFIPSFLDFQYGAADTKFRAKQSAIEKLAAYGLIDSEGKFKDLTNSYLTLTEELPNSIGIGIGKGKSNLKGGVGETVENVSQLDLDGVYRSYPLKKGKTRGMRIAASQINNRSDLDELTRAVENYKTCLKREGTESKYIKQFATFMGEWRDWLDSAHGQSEDFSEKQESLADLVLEVRNVSRIF